MPKVIDHAERSSLALTIIARRHERLWRQRDLADRCGLSNSVIAQIEADARPARPMELASIALAFETTMEELVTATHAGPIAKRLIHPRRAPPRGFLARLFRARWGW